MLFKLYYKCAWNTVSFPSVFKWHRPDNGFHVRNAIVSDFLILLVIAGILDLQPSLWMFVYCSVFVNLRYQVSLSTSYNKMLLYPYRYVMLVHLLVLGIENTLLDGENIRFNTNTNPVKCSSATDNDRPSNVNPRNRQKKVHYYLIRIIFRTI